MSLFSGVMDRWQLKQAYKWGKEQASTKLRIFHAYREANPDMPDEGLYYLTILNTSEFTEITTRQVIMLPLDGRRTFIKRLDVIKSCTAFLLTQRY